MLRQAALVLTKPAEVGILMQARAAGACLPSRHPRVLLVARRACIYATSAPSIMFAPCCRPALREPGCRTLLQIARAVVGLDRTGMPSCPGAANETSPPRPSFPEGSILPPPPGQIGVLFRRVSRHKSDPASFPALSRSKEPARRV